jgi:predicted NBD/HSP70 family sugar kinase
VKHPMWGQLLESMSTGGITPDGTKYGPGGSPAMLGEVLIRAAVAGESVPRSEIGKGSMLTQPSVLASGTVGKAVEALVREELLVAEDTRKSGQPGPPITPLRLDRDRWAIVGIHIDQQHEGPDKLAGIVCGLDRKPLCDLTEVTVPKKGDQHDLDDLVEVIGNLTKALLTGLPGRRRFLGVGVEIGGHVHQGIVKDSVHAGWSQVDLHQVLTNVLSEIRELEHVPVVVENDVNALAIHGYYERSIDGLDVALITVFRQGVGGALLLNDRMYRGIRGMAPEPGHVAAEYPEDMPPAARSATPSTVADRTFADECLCSTKDRKAYGHVDTLAVPARIEGQLAVLQGGRKVSLEEAAAAPVAIQRDETTLVFTHEAVVLRRAGRALGRGLTDMINILNPGHLVLRLPTALATPAPQTSGAEYLAAAEREIDGAYSTGPSDARRENHRLTVQGYDDDNVARDGAIAAATTVFNGFIEHARGLDGCDPVDVGSRRTGPSRRAPREPAATRLTAVPNAPVMRRGTPIRAAASTYPGERH